MVPQFDKTHLSYNCTSAELLVSQWNTQSFMLLEPDLRQNESMVEYTVAHKTHTHINAIKSYRLFVVLHGLSNRIRSGFSACLLVCKCISFLKNRICAPLFGCDCFKKFALGTLCAQLVICQRCLNNWLGLQGGTTRLTKSLWHPIEYAYDYTCIPLRNCYLQSRSHSCDNWGDQTR